MAFGSTFLKLAFIEGKYVEFPLYSTFFAHRNGKLFTDLYLVLSFCIIPPVLEGLIFRGVIIKEHENKGRMTVTIFSAFFFALLGFSPLGSCMWIRCCVDFGIGDEGLVGHVPVERI